MFVCNGFMALKTDKKFVDNLREVVHKLVFLKNMVY